MLGRFDCRGKRSYGDRTGCDYIKQLVVELSLIGRGAFVVPGLGALERFRRRLKAAGDYVDRSKKMNSRVKES